jgi:hypothetical protein
MTGTGRTSSTAAWQESHPVKLAWAARLRRETALSVKPIAERLHLGKPTGARTHLHKFMHNSPTDRPQIQLEI